jgi:cytosine/adenosine deaminase-related metal-dependent hydrolase
MEMLMTGTTTINETWYNQFESGRIVRDLGIRAVIAEMVREGTSKTATSLDRDWDRGLVERGFEKSIELIEEFHGHDDNRITCRIAPHAPDSMREWAMLKCKDMAEQYNLGLHIHLAQVPGETEYMMATTGKRPVKYLNDLGMLGERTIGIHCVFLDDSDIEIMADTKTAMSHTAYLVAKRAYFPPMPKVYASKMRVSLGSDWCSNDMWKIMRTAILFARVLSGRIDIITGYDALRLATLDGAIALGMEKDIGTLTPGKKADIIAVDVQNAWCQPVHDDDIVTNLVYNANGSDVTHVFVDGKAVVKDRVLQTADRDEIFRDAQKVADHVWKEAAEIFQ